jgi:hypothetical protein
MNRFETENRNGLVDDVRRYTSQRNGGARSGIPAMPGDKPAWNRVAVGGGAYAWFLRDTHVAKRLEASERDR